MENVKQVSAGAGAVQLGCVHGNVTIFQCPYLATCDGPTLRSPLKKNEGRFLVKTLLIMAAAMALIGPAWAINKCIGPDGKVFYQDLPCEGQKKVNLSGAGQGNPTGSGSSYYKREAARMAGDEKIEAARLEFEQRTQSAILNKEVFVGMLAEDARKSWGPPDRVNASTGAGGHSEQWVFDRGRSRSQYVYVRGGVVTSMQSSQ